MNSALDDALRWAGRWPHILDTLRFFAESEELETFKTVAASLLDQLREHGGSIVENFDLLTAACPQPISLAGRWHSSASSASYGTANKLVCEVWCAVRPLEWAESPTNSFLRFDPAASIDGDTWPECRAAVLKFFDQFDAADVERLSVLVERERVKLTILNSQPSAIPIADATVEGETAGHAAIRLTEQAIAILVENNSLTVAQIADRLGVHRNTPRRWPKFMAVFNGLKTSDCYSVRRGERDRETGEIIAHDVDEPVGE